MNYSELTDFEINKAVAIASGYAEENCEFGWTGKPDVGVEWNEETGYPIKSFDYCNSWADAGPIILANKITISAPMKYDQPADWLAYPASDSDICVSHPNPLRAAMTAFLVMQESNNA